MQGKNPSQSKNSKANRDFKPSGVRDAGDALPSNVSVNSFVELDGVKMKVEVPDLDGDGVRGEVETIRRGNDGRVMIQHPSELSETLKTLNDDALDPQTGMSAIDMKSRINLFERNGVVALDTLVALRVCPRSCLSFTRQIKRLNVSLGGKGRQEFVDVVGGQRSHEEKKGGFGEWLKGKMPGGSG
jgi:hypothetical protein